MISTVHLANANMTVIAWCAFIQPVRYVFTGASYVMPFTGKWTLEVTHKYSYCSHSTQNI